MFKSLDFEQMTFATIEYYDKSILFKPWNQHTEIPLADEHHSRLTSFGDFPPDEWVWLVYT